MKLAEECFKKVKKDCFKFIKLQETSTEKFGNKKKMVKNFLIPICFWIVKKVNNQKPYFVGLAGGQGTGKTTISSIIKIILEKYFKLKVFKISIDDFYKTRKERIALSKKVHPMLLTRGVPGTHDINMMLDFFKKSKAKKFKKLKLPNFNKAIDDRFPKNKWNKINSRPDVIIFEGWCVGAKHQTNKLLRKPLNLIEKKFDSKSIWRKKVNNQLKYNYSSFFKKIDKLVFLKVPDFQSVYKWRLLQERKLQLTSKSKKTMTSSQVKRFIMFYERVTKQMIKDLPKKAHVVLYLNKKHNFYKIKFN